MSDRSDFWKELMGDDGESPFDDGPEKEPAVDDKGFVIEYLNRDGEPIPAPDTPQDADMTEAEPERIEPQAKPVYEDGIKPQSQPIYDDDIEGYEEPVSALIKQALQKDWGSPDDPSSTYCMMEEEGMVPNGFMGVSEDGVTWYFQPYVIASYSKGVIEAKVSWYDLKPYLSKTVSKF